MKRILLMTMLAATVGAANSQNCVDDWAYAVPININNIGNPDTLFDFQVILDVPTDALISNSKMQANGEDIRFTNGDCCTQLCYNIEKGINTANTIIAVNIPMIPAGDSISIFMHYGNPNAQAGDDPDCVYLFWDDFNDNVFDSTKWEIRDGFDTLVESNGILTMVGTQSWDYIKSNVNFKSDTILLRDRWTSYIGGGASGTCYSFPGNDNRYTYRNSGNNMWTTSDNNLDFSNSGYLTGVPALPHPHNLNQFYEYEMVTTLTGNNIHYVSGVEVTTSTVDNTTTPFTLYADTAYKVGYSGHGTTAGGMKVDYIFVTKYNSHAPAYTLGAEQNVNGGDVSTNDTAFCAGDSVVLDGGAGWNSYLWSTGDTLQSITVNTGAAYTVSRPNSLGCDVVDTITVTENPLPDATFSSTNVGLGYNFTNTETNGMSWEWDFGDGDTAQTQNPSHTFPAEGDYTVCLTVTDSNGCVATHCDTISASFPVGTDAPAVAAGSVKVYPNPTTGMLQLSKTGNVTVFSLTGTVLLRQNQMNAIDMSSLADGVYFIAVETGEGRLMKKVVLER